jgi:hypothetical protein
MTEFKNGTNEGIKDKGRKMKRHDMRGYGLEELARGAVRYGL